MRPTANRCDSDRAPPDRPPDPAESSMDGRLGGGVLGVVDAACQRAEAVQPVQIPPLVMHAGAGIGAACAVAKAV